MADKLNLTAAELLGGVQLTPEERGLVQAKTILRMNSMAKDIGLPTYTELETMLTELAVYVRRDVSADAMQASASRAFALLGT